MMLAGGEQFELQSKRDVSTCSCGMFIGIIFTNKNCLPGYVPLTLQTFMVYVIALTFKPNNAFAACFVYLCMGAIGLPVFAGFHGGISSLVSYTGGYLFAFPIMAYVISCSKHINRYGACFLGTFVCYAMEQDYFMLVSQGFNAFFNDVCDSIFTRGSC